MIRNRILEQLGTALHHAAPTLNGLLVDEPVLSSLKLERPRNAEHGDYAVNVSFLARQTKMPPPKIAEAIAAHWPNSAVATVTVVGGYLNFTLTEAILQQALVNIIRSKHPGLNDSFKDQRILLEYVSANPTGPLHVGHGRWAALGDSIVRILRHCAALVTPEFYINDAGVQMENITHSVYWRCMELLKAEGSLPDGIVAPEALPYPGEYVIEIAAQYLSDAARKQAFLASYAQNGPIISPELCADLKCYTRQVLLEIQQTLLKQMRVEFESWISEKEYLYDRDVIGKTLQTLTQKGFTYEADDALWFKSSEFGDEKDRVLRKSDGSYTYLMPDIAYHDDKFNRPEGYNRILNIWGADHHGYIARMRGAIEALGHDPGQFEVLLGQLVNLIVEGERTRMGKRRKMLTLQDVVDEVGVDATRFWMVSKSADSSLDFDVDLAASASSENPVFYVQYAHARCCSILRNAVESAPNVDTGEMTAPFVQADALTNFETSLAPDQITLLFDSLTDAKDKAILKNLLLMLDGFEDIVKDAARLRAPHFLTQYMQDVSAQFHSFYGVCRILTPEPPLTMARLMLIRAIQKTLAEALGLLGVTAPEKM
jgi:arginyl-tRNA synthetase